MKFANKLFFATTSVLTVIFAIFGIWLLSSYFNKSMNREMEQAETENRMFQYLFEIAYQSLEEYGDDYAIRSAVDSVANSVEKADNHCFVWSKEDIFYGDTKSCLAQLEALMGVGEKLDLQNNYGCGIRQVSQRYYLMSVCVVSTNEQQIYLGISKDVTTMYEDRQGLMNQYRLALVILLVVGGICIYILSQYITKPIRKLDAVVEQISRGNYDRRSRYKSSDEIGTLSDNFNHMADCLMEQMHVKELEAKQKESFTAAFAHELKTPLTSIIGYADMLNSIDMSEEERREAYYYIYSQGKRLESLSHKLLELVSLEQTPLQIRPVNTKDLEENIRETFRPIFEKKNIRGKINLEKGVIYGDKDLLLSVFYNLLDNATKAASKDGFVLLKGKKVDNGYEVKVVDNGRGIPESEINRITEAFYMVDKSRSRKEGGAGIGMTLCQKIITLHKGILKISSRLGEGTIVQLRFPDKVRSE